MICVINNCSTGHGFIFDVAEDHDGFCIVDGSPFIVSPSFVFVPFPDGTVTILGGLIGCMNRRFRQILYGLVGRNDLVSMTTLLFVVLS